MSQNKKILVYLGFHFILSMVILYISPRFDIISLSLFLISHLILASLFLYAERKREEEIDGQINELFDLLNSAYGEMHKFDFEDSRFAKFKDEICKIMTEKNEINIQNLKSKENLKTYMEDIAHQIKTPLTGILLILDLMEAGENKGGEYSKIMRKDINRLYQLTDILLKMSSIDSGLIVMKKEIFSAKDVISEIILNLESYFIDRNLNIKVEGHDFDLKLDRNWTLEAVFNIVKNGLEASMEKGIQIELASNNIYQSIIVRDYGKGIDKDLLAKMYKRFYKADPNSKGFGIGLSMAKAIVQKQNGELLYKKEKNSNYFEIRFYL